MLPTVAERADVAPGQDADALAASKGLFIRRWGEMANYWGINRTMAEIHALLLVSSEPVCTDDVMARLSISRGNASMNLRSLVDWGLIERIHQRGDRKEYFVCHTEVWQMFEIIVRQRRRREVEPIIETLEYCRDMIPKPNGRKRRGPPSEAEAYRRRLEEMGDLIAAIGTLLDLLLKVGPRGISRMGKIMRGLV